MYTHTYTNNNNAHINNNKHTARGFGLPFVNAQSPYWDTEIAPTKIR